LGEDLRHNPRHPWALFGLWQSVNLQGRTADAEWVQKQFEEVWKNADVKLRIEDYRAPKNRIPAKNLAGTGYCAKSMREGLE
jgi:hypothetical protein